MRRGSEAPYLNLLEDVLEAHFPQYLLAQPDKKLFEEIQSVTLCS
jgi:hypothetical protein